MKKIAFLFAFLAFFAESSAKNIKVYFRDVEFPDEVRETHEFIGDAILKNILLAIKTELCNSLILVDDPSSAKYFITARLENVSGGRLGIMLEAKSGNVVITPDSRISVAGNAEEMKEFNQLIHKGTASMCSKINSHESRHDNTLRPFVPGLAQWHKGYPVFGTTIIVAEVATLLVGGIYASKASDSNNEADASKKKAALATNADDFNKYMSDAESFDDDFKTKRGIAIGMFSAAVAVYAINVTTGFVLRNTNVAVMPVVSPRGELAGLYWTMNF